MSQLIELFHAHKDPSFAAWQEAYMRHQFPFIGLRGPIRKRLQANHLKTLTKKEVLTLWEMREREFQYAAMDLCLCHRFDKEDLSLLEKLICTKSWWDTVDILSSNHCGKYFQSFKEEISTTRRWLHSGDLWLRRASLLFQLRYKEETDSALLFDYCRTAADDRNPFIQRAIGWALREYGKTAATTVLRFIDKERAHFSALCLREALAILITHHSQAT